MKPRSQPHILLITADQMRWDTMRCAGNPVIQTPHLDALAARGMRFTQAFTPNPICIPARASIMTGNYPQVCTGQKGNRGGVHESQPLITDTLHQVGYRCYITGKLHFSPYARPGTPRRVLGFDTADVHESGRILANFDPRGELRGLEDYFDYLADSGWYGYARGHGAGNNDVRPCPSPLPADLYVDRWIADRTCARLDDHVRDHPESPFFLWMSSPKPHSPYDPPRPYDTLYDPRNLPAPFGSSGDLMDRCPGIDLARYTHGVNSLSPEAWQVIRSYYYGNITFLDAMIGRVLHHLEILGLLEHTIIFFAADHGDLLGDFGSCFKTNHLNGSVRIPFLAAGPGIAAGVTSSALVGLQDLHPTFADQAGTIPSGPVQGLCLSSVLAGRSDFLRDEYYATTETECGFSSMLATPEWKYIYSEAGATEELYDQLRDPGELTNLARSPDRDPVRIELRNRMEIAAHKFQDHSIFETDGTLRFREFDRGAFPQVKPTLLGWRYY